MRIRGLCDAFGIKLPIAAYCSHSQANGDQEDFEETYAARPDCFQDTFYNNILTSKNFGKPLGDPLPCVQYIDPEVPLLKGRVFAVRSGPLPVSHVTLFGCREGTRDFPGRPIATLGQPSGSSWTAMKLGSTLRLGSLNQHYFF
jgi:hypothetical protein